MLRTAALSLTRRAASSSAVSPAALSDIPARWSQLQQVDREHITDQLLEAQKNDWKALSAEQKRALFYIAFGPHGQRERLPKGFQVRVFLGTLGGLAAATGLFYFIRSKGQEYPRTFTKEWQEATNEYTKSQNGNPYTGVSSPGYSGKGHVSFTTKE
ncbi:Cytochrome c oxidase subunit 5B, mitochondrial [Sorochytrium milnesiophthora]